MALNKETIGKIKDEVQAMVDKYNEDGEFTDEEKAEVAMVLADTILKVVPVVKKIRDNKFYPANNKTTAKLLKKALGKAIDMYL